MNWARFVLAAVVAYVVLVASGGLWHLELFKRFYALQLDKVARPVFLMPGIAAAEGVRAIVFALIFPLGYKGGAAWKEGLRFGLLMALLSAAGFGIVFAELNIATLNWLWAELAFFAVQCTLACIAIAYCYSFHAPPQKG